MFVADQQRSVEGGLPRHFLPTLTDVCDAAKCLVFGAGRMLVRVCTRCHQRAMQVMRQPFACARYCLLMAAASVAAVGTGYASVQCVMQA